MIKTSMQAVSVLLQACSGCDSRQWRCEAQESHFEAMLAMAALYMLPAFIAPVLAYGQQTLLRAQIDPPDRIGSSPRSRYSAGFRGRETTVFAQSISANAAAPSSVFIPIGPWFFGIAASGSDAPGSLLVEANGYGQFTNLRGWPNFPLIQEAHNSKVRVVLVCTLLVRRT